MTSSWHYPNQPLEDAHANPHVITVSTHDEDDEYYGFYLAGDRYYEVEHNACCPRVEHHQFETGGETPTGVVLEYLCAVQYELDNAGLDGLRFKWQEYLPDGEYKIMAWVEYSAGGPWGPPEADGGLELQEVREKGGRWASIPEPSSGMMFTPHNLTEWIAEHGRPETSTS